MKRVTETMMADAEDFYGTIHEMHKLILKDLKKVSAMGEITEDHRGELRAIEEKLREKQTDIKHEAQCLLDQASSLQDAIDDFMAEMITKMKKGEKRERQQPSIQESFANTPKEKNEEDENEEGPPKRSKTAGNENRKMKSGNEK